MIISSATREVFCFLLKLDNKLTEAIHSLNKSLFGIIGDSKSDIRFRFNLKVKKSKITKNYAQPELLFCVDDRSK